MEKVINRFVLKKYFDISIYFINTNYQSKLQELDE